MAEDFPHHEALETAHDLRLALSFGRAAPDVVDRRLVAAHAHDAVKGGVGLPVATAVEPVTGDLAARGGDRAGAAELGKGALGVDPFRVVADQDQHLRGGTCLDTIGRHQGRSAVFDQGLEVNVVGLDPGVEVEPSTGEGPQAGLGRSGWGRHCPRTQCGEMTDQRHRARNRLKLVTCDSSCPHEVSDTGILTFTPPSSSPRYNLSFGLTIVGLIAFMGSIWALKIEYYPLTAMPMFASVRRSVVTYFKTIGHRESGAISPIYLEDSLGAVSINSRYESLFDFCFSDKPRDLEICKKTFSVLGSAYNKKTPPGEKVTQYEIQRWTWDFVSNPQDPNYGTLDARMIFDISSGSITK